ncbi:hypothetical protein [Treponema sp.]|uniref:hypothetical protein n=1 Tax=Treponema sp. TaxID=166 RepID=UPI00298DE7DE|nr:hypothetical protein [Treponema sp.]MCQ2241154.1 helicase-associated domain-containing protein [Treponema sp.]
MKLDPKVERIIEWRESFTSLPDDYFFDVIHMYLGEIKTPYNKPKLVEELSVILRKKENRETLIAYLDETDVRILTAVRFIPDVDIVKLEKFFVPAMSRGDLYEEIASLEERLIIYNRENKITGKKTIALNPHLEEELEKILQLGNLIAEEPKPEEEEIPSGIKLTPQLMAVFIAYVLSHPEFCKANGELKKKTDTDLKEICGIESTEIFKRLFMGMRNLVLLRETSDGKGWEVEWKRMEAFCALPFKSQVVYLCVAGAGTFTRRALVSNASFFAGTLDFARGKYFTKEKLFAVAFLIKEKNGDEDFSTRRFSRILSGFNSEEQNENLGSAMIESMIDSAIAFGLMSVRGTTDKGSELVFAETEGYQENFSSEKKLLSVDTGYTVTILPGLSTQEFLPLVRFLDAVGCDVTSNFEINRQSVIRGFDLGYTKEMMEEILSKYSSFPLPQNLRVSLEEWSLSYNSAALYKGYVLTLSEENIFRAENNPVFSRHIRKVLAPGVYLLDFSNDAEVQDVMKKSGIDVNGKIKGVHREEEVQGLPPAKATPVSLEESSNGKFSIDERTRLGLLERFKSALEEIETTSDQKDGLLDRIARRIIIEEDQLRPSSVRFELMEAFGMNFTGKVHVLESAIQKNSLVEIELTGKEEKILGIPKGIVKNIDVPVVFLSIEDKDTKEFSDVEIEIAKISRVRKIRNALSLRRTK